MQFLRSPYLAIALGALLVFMLAAIGGRFTGPGLAAQLAQQAPAVIEKAGGGTRVEAHFRSPSGWPSRHPLLTGGEPLDETTRQAVALAVNAIPGAGGIRWSDGDALVEADEARLNPLHCQEDVQALLRARTIRFEESSARIDKPSRALIAEVAQALRPCLGAIIAITGHTDKSGPDAANIALSRERALAVRQALIARGIPADGLRAEGKGSHEPVEGLLPSDPANRRIEFEVLATEPIKPTPVDTPSAR